MKIWNSLIVPKNVKAGTLGIFKHPFCWIKIIKIANVGSLHPYCVVDVGRGSDVSRMFWTSVVQVEQMNKNVELTCQYAPGCESLRLSERFLPLSER